MENTLSFDNLNNEINLDKSLNLEVKNTEKAFSNIVQNTIGKGADYVIKTMPVSEPIKNILLDVRKSFESRDFKKILSTAIQSSIEEGVKFLNIPKNCLRDISTIVNASFKGGLKEAVSATIDIVANKYLKNNIFYNFVKDFINKTKAFVFNRDFKDRIDKSVQNLLKKVENYKEKCNEWYESYNKLDFNKINDLAKSLNKEKRFVNSNSECLKQNNIIQNMTKLVNVKKDKLSNIQMQICSNL